jgi:steroid delta-isomerase-like uncharacterized protein
MQTLDETKTVEYTPPAQIAAGLFDAWNSHDVDRVMSFYAAEYEGVDVGQPSPEHGLDGKRRAVLVYLHAFPDLNFTIEETIEQGNMVAVRWTARGTHRGRFMNIPPAGCPISVRGVSILTFQGEKVVRANYIWDVAGLLREIGLLPEL